MPPSRRACASLRTALKARTGSTKSCRSLSKKTDGLVVISGCAHRGIVNIVRDALDAFPGRALKAVIGGFHLGDASLERA
jgi:metal-dependent hydrolase (beta-lactamase superfamily II)